MFSAPLLAIAILASPINCAPDIGQVRWDNIRQDLRGQNLTVHGSIWDQDRDGRPSLGDIMRIDSATRGRRAIAVNETWIVLGQRLAKEIEQTVERRWGRGDACETGISVTGLPRLKSGKALARSLIRRDQKARPKAGGRAEAETLEAEMIGDVERACDGGKNLSERALTQLLKKKSTRRHRQASRKLVRAIAIKVARAHAHDCAHLEMSDSSTSLTF